MPGIALTRGGVHEGRVVTTTTAEAGRFDAAFDAGRVRRLMTVPAVVCLSSLLLVFWPGLFLLAGIHDVVRPRRCAGLRMLVFVSVMLLMESAGIVLGLLVWLAETGRFDAARFQRRNYRLQNWWGGTLARAGIWIYRLNVVVEAPFAPRDRPFILFVRHASFVDTLLPLLLVSAPNGIRLRYVLKQELLWDPCLDIVGHRIPNVFVRRGTDDSAPQVAAVRALARGLETGEGVVIYPEGTRFSAAKRQRSLERAKERGPEAFHSVARFQSVLPPRLGGSLALLGEATGADAVFCAHSGLQSTSRARQLLSGRLVGSTIRVSFRTVPRADIPMADLEPWFLDQWASVDRAVREWETLEAAADTVPASAVARGDRARSNA